MKKILFVCLGNICRSPAAEGIMNKILIDKNLTDEYQCDSAGTTGYHAGERADARMIAHAKKRNYDLTSRSRQFDPACDFAKFDYIITMDEHNYQNVYNSTQDKKYRSKIHSMVSFCSRHKVNKVPDPYYGGEKGFEQVLDILEDACHGLLKHIQDDC